MKETQGQTLRESYIERLENGGKVGSKRASCKVEVQPGEHCRKWGKGLSSPQLKVKEKRKKGSHVT